MEQVLSVPAIAFGQFRLDLTVDLGPGKKHEGSDTEPGEQNDRRSQ
jgi:hypothetical protein